MEAVIEVRYFRGGVEVGSPITVNQAAEHPDITDFDLNDYINWAKDAFSIGADIYGGKWIDLVKDIGTALRDVFGTKNRSTKKKGRLTLLGPGAIPAGGTAVDEATLTFRAWSEDRAPAFSRNAPDVRFG